MDLIEVDPAELLVDRNVREVALDEAFLGSIRTLGVLVPVVAVRTSEDVLRVRYGHRRTVAAVTVGLQSIRVVVAGDDADGDDAADAQRVIEQWAENEHRAGLTVTEQVAAVEQLAALGLPAEEIARRTHAAPERVTAALRVAQAPRARTLLGTDEGTVDLIQAAVIAEFDDDPEIVAALIRAAAHGQLEHEAQRYRDERAVAAETLRLEAGLCEAGVKLVEPEEREEASPLPWLRGADGRELTTESHADCPGHIAWVSVMPAWQWQLEGDDDEAATRRCRVVYACADPRAYGHSGGRGNTVDRPTTKLADLSEEDREAERARRRDVIDSNKAWESATAVRRRWLAEHVPARKTAPKGTAAFLARLLVSEPQVVASVEGNHYAAELLGQDRPRYGRGRGIADLAGKASDTRALVIVLTHALACCEDATNRDNWRTRSATTVIYLQFLASMGYTLSDVETRAVKL